MLTPGDVVDLHLGTPTGAEAGLARPSVVVTARQVLRGEPNVVQVVPLTRTLRNSGAEVTIEPDQTNGLTAVSAAQCQHIRSVAVGRVTGVRGQVGEVVLAQIRQVLAVLLDI